MHGDLGSVHNCNASASLATLLVPACDHRYPFITFSLVHLYPLKQHDSSQNITFCKHAPCPDLFSNQYNYAVLNLACQVDFWIPYGVNTVTTPLHISSRSQLTVNMTGMGMNGASYLVRIPKSYFCQASRGNISFVLRFLSVRCWQAHH